MSVISFIYINTNLQGHAFYDPAKKPNIYFKDCFDDLKSNVKK